MLTKTRTRTTKVKLDPASRRQIEAMTRAMGDATVRIAQELREDGFPRARSASEILEGKKVGKGSRKADEKPSALKSTLHRLRRQLLPWKVAGGVYGAAALSWTADWITGSIFTPEIALGTTAAAGLTAGIGLLVKRDERLASRWRRRILAATWTGAGWLSTAAILGPSWSLTGAWMAATLALSAGYWRDVRITTSTPKPIEPKVDDEPRETLATLWAETIGARSGELPGSMLTDRHVDGDVEKWTLRLVRGRQSLSKVRQALPLIETALAVPAARMTFEPVPEHPHLVTLTITSRARMQEVVEFTGPTYREQLVVKEKVVNGEKLRKEWVESWLEPGAYTDGTGRVPVPLTGDNSVRNVAFVGGQGSGKSSLILQMALSAMSSGQVVIWYLDGQDGASSPELLKYADWAPTGPHRERLMVEALEAVFEARSKLLVANEWRGWPVSPEWPALIVIVDECHVFWRQGSEFEARWTELSTMSRKVGVGFWSATQYPEMKSYFGSMAFRSAMMLWTTLALKTKGRSAQGILEADVDPSQLPPEPGLGYVIGGKPGARTTAMWRADYLDELSGEAWFRRISRPTLDAYTANAVGEVYTKRREASEKARRELRANVQKLANGEATGLAGLFERPKLATVTPLAVPTFPTFPPPPEPSEAKPDPKPARRGARDAVLEAVRGGATSTGEIIAASGVSESQGHEVLKRLTQEGAIVRVGRGQYEPNQ